VGKRAVLVAAGWAVTAVAAALLGTAALNTLGAGILGPSTRTLSQTEVRDRLAGTTAPSVVAPSSSAPATSAAPPAPDPTPSGTGTATVTPPTAVPTTQPGGRGPVPTGGPGGGPPAAAQPRTEVLATAGGTIVAECTGGQVTLRSWSPAQGYEVHDVDRGPATQTRVRFRGDSGEVRVEITCVGGAPKAATRIHD
jgi:hypothetical protein